MASCKNPDKSRRHKDTVMNSLKDLFGNVVHIDIIRSVAVQCNFDAQKSSNLLLEITNNKDAGKKKKTKSPQNTPKKNQNRPTTLRTMQPSSSVTNIPVTKSKKTMELERVVGLIRQGFKVLVILRGLPGSGKSRLAVTLTALTLGPGNNSDHILSTDDFFVQEKSYVFDPARLQEAHEWNHRRAFKAMSKGLSPVIIDNTNTQMWEMKPYAMMATDYGYIIEILEPDTWWCFNDKELAKRNTHGVLRAKIKDMLDRYEKNVTRDKLLSAYNLMYKFQKPPQFRLIPPIIRNGFAQMTYQPNHFAPTSPNGVFKSRSTSALNRQHSSSQSEDGVETINLMDFSEEVQEMTPGEHGNSFPATNPVDEILMCTEENDSYVLQPDQVEASRTSFLDIENAWGVDEKALQSWDIVTPVKCDYATPIHSSSSNEESKPETKESTTNVEPSDYVQDYSQVPQGFRVLAARGRDINTGPLRSTLIPPKKPMRDQSCITEDLGETDGKTEESRIQDLVDLFPKVSRSALRELYNKCNKNFYWTVDLLLEDNYLDVEEIEDAEEAMEERKTTNECVEVIDDSDHEETVREVARMFKKKTISEDSRDLKKAIEEKIDFPKEHYSEHVLKVKQSKFGSCEEPQPSTSAAIELDSDSDDCEDDSSDHSDDPKNFIELNLGETFVAQLETMFGGDDGAFPKGYQPVVQMPIALARQIYSFYVESICQQMEAQNHILECLVKEDEDFARKLQSQEVEAIRPAPTLMEIIDEQVAQNLHQKDINSWKNMTADDLAAKLTKQKLFNAFPNVDRESLVEIWHAYDYDYNKTVSDLIASVGPEQINGTHEAIAEPPLSSTALQEMKEAEEFCVEELEEAKPATYYREVATNHLRNRAKLYEKARSYYQRGMTEVAQFYSELAKKETKSYDKANHIAAVTFNEEHSQRLQKVDTLDLHYFYIKEAMETLDIFIDRNIDLLRGGTKRGIDLFVITGRGRNSQGGVSRIKPAVIARLKKRKISFVHMNPGLLKIRVFRESIVTSDLP